MYTLKPPRWEQDWPFKTKRLAYTAVHEAVVTGKLQRASDLACADCGGAARDYDHFNGYDRENWLTVEPVCRSCHMKREGGRVQR